MNFIPLHFEKKCVVLMKIMDREYKHGPSEEKDQWDIPDSHFNPDHLAGMMILDCERAPAHHVSPTPSYLTFL